MVQRIQKADCLALTMVVQMVGSLAQKKVGTKADRLELPTAGRKVGNFHLVLRIRMELTMEQMMWKVRQTLPICLLLLQ